VSNAAFQCPSGHFLIQTDSFHQVSTGTGLEFQCPSGHFLIQTDLLNGADSWQQYRFQCPSGHFLIQTIETFEKGGLMIAGFQCPSGHFLIQTVMPVLAMPPGAAAGSVSMPVRAFLDSDHILSFLYITSIRYVSMPVRAFLDSDQTIRSVSGYRRMRFNARQGIS